MDSTTWNYDLDPSEDISDCRTVFVNVYMCRILMSYLIVSWGGSKCFLFAVKNSKCMCSQDLASCYIVKVVLL